MLIESHCRIARGSFNLTKRCKIATLTLNLKTNHSYTCILSYFGWFVRIVISGVTTYYFNPARGYVGASILDSLFSTRETSIVTLYHFRLGGRMFLTQKVLLVLQQRPTTTSKASSKVVRIQPQIFVTTYLRSLLQTSRHTHQAKSELHRIHTPAIL